MQTQFYDREDLSNLSNGICFSRGDEISSFLEELRSREPFFFELVGSNGFNLMIGLGGDIGCAQYGATSGEPPYLMAQAKSQSNNGNEYYEFLTGGTPTPVESQFCLSYNTLKNIVCEFVESGYKSPSITWKEV